MFKPGDYMVYGSYGVCQVQEIGPMNMDGAAKDRLYYTLAPVYVQGSRVYTPVDNQKVVMRPVISKEELSALIDKIPDIEELWVADERGREQIYKNAIKSCESQELIKIIKDLYLRKKTRLEDGKKVTAVDEKYLKLAENQLYGEWAIPLGMERDNVEAYIMDCMNKIMI